MQNQAAIGAKFGRFEGWSEDEIAYLIEELGYGMGRDATERFEGYWGAHCALNIARAFVSHGDSPWANEVAVAWMGALTAYSLDSHYWGNETVPADPGNCATEHRTAVCALAVIECAARPVQHAHGLEDIHRDEPR